jgi:molybdopterin converting factor small subunit|tara:strand:+ start:3127 stop:3360 length:234 start_codon:yes stop_codon:yes gene_type:complete
MEIKLKYHGRLTEVFGKSQDTITVVAITAEDLKKELKGYDLRFRESVFQIAQNNKIIEGSDILTTAAVDIFPPFSGG